MITKSDNKITLVKLFKKVYIFQDGVYIEWHKR